MNFFKNYQDDLLDKLPLTPSDIHMLKNIRKLGGFQQMMFLNFGLRQRDDFFSSILKLEGIGHFHDSRYELASGYNRQTDVMIDLPTSVSTTVFVQYLGGDTKAQTVPIGYLWWMETYEVAFLGWIKEDSIFMESFFQAPESNREEGKNMMQSWVRQNAYITSGSFSNAHDLEQQTISFIERIPGAFDANAEIMLAGITPVALEAEAKSLLLENGLIVNADEVQFLFYDTQHTRVLNKEHYGLDKKVKIGTSVRLEKAKAMLLNTASHMPIGRISYEENQLSLVFFKRKQEESSS